MKKALHALLPALCLVALPAAAGHEEHHKSCTAEVSTCIREMADSLRKKGWVGIEWEEVDDRPQITLVVAGSPAEAAGVRVGDVVMAFNGIPTDRDDEEVWAEMKRSLVPGKVVTLSVLRDGKPRDLDVELVAVPDYIVAQWVGKHVLEHHVTAAEADGRKSP